MKLRFAEFDNNAPLTQIGLLLHFEYDIYANTRRHDASFSQQKSENDSSNAIH
jgi:hypothetical protein